MNISRIGKWIVAIAAGIGVIIGTAKTIADIFRTINGWHVLALLSVLTLCALSIDWYIQWLKGRFENLQNTLTDKFDERFKRLSDFLGRKF